MSSSKHIERRTRAPARQQKEVHVPLSTSPRWDVSSVDSGFCSDVEKRVANLTLELEKDIQPTIERRRRTRKFSHEDIHNNDDYRKMTSRDMVKRSTGRNLSHESTRKCRTLPALPNRQKPEIELCDLSLRDLVHVRVLGRGGYARVDLVKLKHDHSKVFALKKMNKNLIEERRQVEHVMAEKEVMHVAKSRFIPTLYRTFHSPENIFMLSEACLGGDLFSVLERHGRLKLPSLQFVLSCVAQALEYLHNILNVLHRDVKTENVLIDHKGCAKLADLGFCKRLQKRGERSFTFCGTPGYVAPEILLRNGHDKSCDFFSLGVVLFESGTCRSPFRRQVPIDTHRATLRGITEVPFPSYFGNDTVDLITRMCAADPRCRLGSAEQVKSHPILQSVDWVKLKSGKTVSPLLDLISTPITSSHNSKEVFYGTENEIYDSATQYEWDKNF